MFLDKYRNISGWFSFRNSKNKLPGIIPPRDYQSIITRERARADRYGNKFSLVIFEVGSKSNGELAEFMAHIFSKRRRSIDRVGWLDSNQIGALLPETGVEGARKFGESVCQTMSTDLSPPVFRVFVYPGPALYKPTGNVTQPGNTNISEKSNLIQAQRDTSFIDKLEPLLCPKMPAWKCFLDVGGALFLLVLLWPVFLVLAAYIKIVSPGPAFFKQQRVGYMGSLFTCLKFRTMKVDADFNVHQAYLNRLINSEEPMIKLDDKADPRIIPLGRFLRYTGLDELPQLLNVLRGQMSLVGPRPCTLYEAQEYIRWQNKRFDTKPGITGLWQVSGKNRTTFKEMIRLDVQYVEQRSFWLDMKIFLKTFPAVIAEAKVSLFWGKE